MVLMEILQLWTVIGIKDFSQFGMYNNTHLPTITCTLIIIILLLIKPDYQGSGWYMGVSP